jgi:Zn-dependent protease with chaperone function
VLPATQSCPECGITLPVHQGFVTWCHGCGWNLTAPPTIWQPRTRFDRLYAAAGRRLGNRLAQELLSAQRLQPRLTGARFTAYLIAALTHLTTLVFAVGGILLVVLAFPNPAAIVGGVILVGLAWLMRPRLGKVPTENVLTRDDAPALYALVDRVADTLHMRHVDMIVVDHVFNASWSILGLRRRSVLTLGLPVLMLAGPQERVALIGHELAHGRNGDSSSLLFVGSAVRGLAEFYSTVAPEDFDGAREWGELAVFERLANAVLWVISRPVLGLLMLELHLLLQDSQRAEYLADALAARVAGTSATISMHERLLLQSTFELAVQRTAHDRGNSNALIRELGLALSAVPDRELERRRRVARLEDARLETTHPPTAKRIELLEGRASVDAAVVCSEDETRAIEEELAHRHDALAAKLIDDYRDSLYGRYY